MSKPRIPNYSKPRISPSNVRTRTMTEAEIRKIKEEAVQQAVKILESNQDIQRIRNEAYDEAYDDAIVSATKYFVLCGCKVLHEQFGFGYKRLARFVDQVASLEVDVEEGKTTLEELEDWLGIEVGMILSKQNIEDALQERQEG